MCVTGLGFAAITSFWPLLVVAVVGTLNPSAGDVSAFLPTEQAFIADRVSGPARTRTYAVYNVGGGLAGALGALVLRAARAHRTRHAMAADIGGPSRVRGLRAGRGGHLRAVSLDTRT